MELTDAEILKAVRYELNPSIVISALTDFTGNDYSKHKIWLNENNEYRITCDTRNYNVSDFLIKEVGLSFADTKEFLVGLYKSQQKGQLEVNDTIDADAQKAMVLKNLLKEQTDITNSFVKEHIKPYVEAIDLVRIKYKGNEETAGKLALGSDCVGVSPNSISTMLHDKKSLSQNVMGDENIFLSLSEDSKSRIVWLDDLPHEAIEKNDFTVIQTSKNSFQGFVKFDRFMTKEEIKLIKDELVVKLGCDNNAKAHIQPMRLPGFLNQKPKHKDDKTGQGFLIKVVKESHKEFNADKTIARLREVQETIQANNQDTLINEIKVNATGVAPNFKNGNKQAVRKTLSDFNRGSSQHENDFTYACYLAVRGKTEAEIALAILSEREGIIEKKGSQKQAQNYAEKTAMKAVEYAAHGQY